MSGVIAKIMPLIVKERHGDFIKKCVRKCAKMVQNILSKNI
nr:MAG TPA: hypothetical protein [Ackermannviridae sp.]